MIRFPICACLMISLLTTSDGWARHESLGTDQTDRRRAVAKTEAVWALGQLPDRRAYEPLLEVRRSLRNVRTSDRTSQEGKLWDAVLYALKQLDGFDHFN
jgi:hypothetical protein